MTKVTQHPCPQCNGNGRDRYARACGYCNGFGFVQVQHR